jgi:hypothetical protein
MIFSQNSHFAIGDLRLGRSRLHLGEWLAFRRGFVIPGRADFG